MALSFVQGRKIGAQPYRATNRGDPMNVAKQHIISAIEGQKRLVNLLLDGEEIPRQKGKRNVVWFYQDPIDKTWWTTLRYGQFTIPVSDAGDSAIQIGTLNDLHPFYDQVIRAINNGEMDTIIAKLRQKRIGKRGGASSAPAEEAPETTDATSSATGRRGRGSRRGGGNGSSAPVEAAETSEHDGVVHF